MEVSKKEEEEEEEDGGLDVFCKSWTYQSWMCLWKEAVISHMKLTSEGGGMQCCISDL